MKQMNNLRQTVLFLTATVLITLLSGCGWLDWDKREDSREKTCIVVVDKGHSTFSGLEHISKDLEELLGEGWGEAGHQVIIITQ